MASTVNITIQDNLEAINLGLNDSDSTVVVTIVDGSNGYTPVKGVDYFDGRDGLDGDSVRVNNVGQVNGNIVLTTDNIPDNTDKRYVTDSQLVVIGNTSGTNTGDEDAASIGAIINGATNYTTPLDADKVGIWDIANSLFKGVTWANIKATLKTYFDTLYKPTFSENTAFNKNFGTTTGTVCQGDDTRLLSYCIQARFYASLTTFTRNNTYYPVFTFGSNIQSDDTRSRHQVLKSGTNINVGFTYFCTAGTSEGVTIRVINVTTGLSVDVTTTLDMSVASANLSYLNAALVYTVGDVIQTQLITPNFVTQPTALIFSLDLMFI